MFIKMVRTKQTPKREDKKMNKDDFVKEPSKWGDASKVGSHQPPRPPPRDHTKVCYRIFKIHVL